MNDFLLYAILIALVPVVITVIMSRLYNIVHGIITFIVMGFLLTFCLQVFGANLPVELTNELPVVLSLYESIEDLIVSLLTPLGILGIFGEGAEIYVLLAIYVVVFVVSQIIACAIRKGRVEKINSLKRQVKRY